MHDDFRELRPGAAKDLERNLNAALKERPAGRPAGTLVQGMAGTELNIALSSHSASEHQNSNNRGPTKTPFRGYDPRPQRDRTVSTLIECETEGRWLLVCAAAKKYPTSLSQMDVRFTMSDQNLFKQLKQSFSKLKGRGSKMFSLRTVKSIRFVQVGNHIGNHCFSILKGDFSLNSIPRTLSKFEKSRICHRKQEKKNISSNRAIWSHLLARI